MRTIEIEQIDDLDITRLTIAPGANVLAARIADCDAQLLPGEQDGVTRALAKRRMEFAAGRTLARIALTEIGHAECAIPQAGRTPVWPSGIVGSIAHDKEYVAVCVLSRETHAGIGIDIETAGRVTAELQARILTPAEIGDASVADAGTLRFSCKEAVYKAVHPIVGEFFGFQAVRIDLDMDSGSFRAEPMHDGPFASYVARGRGAFVQWRGHHLTAFYLDQ